MFMKQGRRLRGLVSAILLGMVAGSLAEELKVDLGNSVTMTLVLIPSGKFRMGSPDGDKGRPKDEYPQHEVTISKPFYMGVYKVTQGQFEQVMGKNPSTWKGDPQLPVEAVSWTDAQEFCKKVSDMSGRKVRLPTEAEWEYACRAGTKTKFCFGDADAQFGDYAWYKDNSSGGAAPIHPVGQKKPNAWGLYDMYGNLLERCSDYYADSYANAQSSDPQGPESGTFRVLRGSNYHGTPGRCSSASRLSEEKVKKNHTIGFRVVVEAK
jgi:formylglycine-generating enzyme required for sulfatase activity